MRGSGRCQTERLSGLCACVYSVWPLWLVVSALYPSTLHLCRMQFDEGRSYPPFLVAAAEVVPHAGVGRQTLVLLLWLLLLGFGCAELQDRGVGSWGSSTKKLVN